MNGQIKHAVSKVTYTKAADGRYRVVNSKGQVNMYSAIDFLEIYSPVAKVVEPNKVKPQFFEEGNLETPFDHDPVAKVQLDRIRAAREPLKYDSTGPIGVNGMDFDSLYPSQDVSSMQLAYIENLKDTESGPVNSFKKEMRKHLEPDTIANLIQSNLDNRPDGYSIDALSRTMLGRIGRNEPRQ